MDPSFPPPSPSTPSLMILIKAKCIPRLMEGPVHADPHRRRSEGRGKNRLRGPASFHRRR